EARPDHVYVRSRTRDGSRDSDGELPASCYLHGDDHSAAERGHTYQYGREGAEAILNLAVADELDGTSGHFYNGLQRSKANQQAYDDTARERLRVLSLQLTGLA